jgi:endogenous inhibitor of DNA gyrase (YacG/DUF329 family)
VDDEFTIQVSLPLDSDGFLRRECPRCRRQFKWHSGPANEEAESHSRPSAYSCPLCGQPAADDSWNTAEQADLIERAAAPIALGLVQDELEAMFRGMRGFEFKRGNGVVADPADPLVEADDMTIVTSPCHGYEPVKVPDEHTGALYCLICGSAFAV